MFRWYSQLLILACLAVLQVAGANADEVLYRYEGDVVPYDPSAGWTSGNPCEPPCYESIEDGHLVLRFPYAGDSTGYTYSIAREPETTPPPTLWVEWRFRSNHPLGPYFTSCDASFTVDYRNVLEYLQMYGDAVLSPGLDDFVLGLDI